MTCVMTTYDYVAFLPWFVANEPFAKVKIHRLGKA